MVFEQISTSMFLSAPHDGAPVIPRKQEASWSQTEENPGLPGVAVHKTNRHLAVGEELIGAKTNQENREIGKGCG